MHEKKRIAVFGAGGIGGVVGGMLSKDEHDVTFIDTWYEHCLLYTSPSPRDRG